MNKNGERLITNFYMQWRNCDLFYLKTKINNEGKSGTNIITKRNVS